MEIIGKRIPGLESAISSGVESVAAGITESAKAFGNAALGIAAQSFSFTDITTAPPATLNIGDVAGAMEPSLYGKRFQEPSYYKDIFGMLSDPNFRADRGLSEFTKNVKTYQESMEELIQKKQEEIEKKMKELNPELYLDTTLEEARGDRSVNGTVAGGTSSDASSRSIIVVGGKTQDTFYLTLDDSVQQLQQNPTTEIAQLYRDQVGAVQNMISTVDQVVEMQKGLMSSMFLGGLRI